VKIRANPNGKQITRLLVLGTVSLMLANGTADDSVASRADRKHAATSPRVAATGEINEHTIRKRTVKTTREHSVQNAT
jgi:hypothetical protein